METLRRFFIAIFWPIRVAIRHELQKERRLLERVLEANNDRLRSRLLRDSQSTESVQDLRLAAQREATQTTASFVLVNMTLVPAFDSQQEVMAHAISEANLLDSDIVCEFGVWSGATINHIATMIQNRIYGFDSFEGLPEDWRTGFHAGHFALDSLPRVAENVELIKGLFSDTLPPFRERTRGRIGLIHIDCDLYSSTSVVFEQLIDRIGPGCVIVFDEFFNYAGWQDGEYRAFMEFVAKSGCTFEYLAYNRRGEQVAVRLT